MRPRGSIRDAIAARRAARGLATERVSISELAERNRAEQGLRIEELRRCSLQAEADGVNLADAVMLPVEAVVNETGGDSESEGSDAASGARARRRRPTTSASGARRRPTTLSAPTASRPPRASSRRRRRRWRPTTLRTRRRRRRGERSARRGSPGCAAAAACRPPARPRPPAASSQHRRRVPMRASVGALVHAWPDPTLRANHATRTSLAAPPDAERHPRAQV